MSTPRRGQSATILLGRETEGVVRLTALVAWLASLKPCYVISWKLNAQEPLARQELRLDDPEEEDASNTACCRISSTDLLAPLSVQATLPE